MRKVPDTFAEGPRCFCTRWNSKAGTLRAKPHHMPSSTQGVAPFLPPCAHWCGRSPNRTLSSTSYFSVGDNLLIISKNIKLGLPISVDLIHLFPCVSNTYLPRRQGGISPFCGMFSSTSSLSVATTRVLRGDSHVLGLFRSYPPPARGVIATLTAFIPQYPTLDRAAPSLGWGSACAMGTLSP